MGQRGGGAVAPGRSRRSGHKQRHQNEPKVAHRNKLLLLWLSTFLGISHNAQHFTFRLCAPPTNENWEVAHRSNKLHFLLNFLMGCTSPFCHPPRGGAINHATAARRLCVFPRNDWNQVVAVRATTEATGSCPGNHGGPASVYLIRSRRPIVADVRRTRYQFLLYCLSPPPPGRP